MKYKLYNNMRSDEVVKNTQQKLNNMVNVQNISSPN